MKNVKFFLVCWLCIHLFFPLQIQAEEQIERDQIINEVDMQEKNKVVQEQTERVEMNQVEEEQKEVTNEQEIGRKIETDQGIITVNKQELKVGEELRITVERNEKSIQSMKGILQLQKNGEQYEQERMLSFEYEEETKRWIAKYKIGIFDLQGDWHLQLIQSYKENEKEELIENEVKVPLIRVNNETPTVDKELPKLHKITVDEAEENVIERKQGDSIRVRVKAADIESVVKEARVILKGKDEIEIPFLLDYNKREMDWQTGIEITDELPIGPYKLFVEIIDAAGNKLVVESEYIVSILEKKMEDGKKLEEKEDENTIEEKNETGKQDDWKVEIPPQEENPPVVQIPRQDEEVNSFIKEPLKENKEVTNAKAQKEKKEKIDNHGVSKKKEEPEEKKEEQGEQGVQASNVFAIMSGLFVLFLVLKSNKEWG
ncbi:transglycosylase [Bacillus sp. SH5-2]|uniref:transglycosylase n=1 Tax=Bacillus sp. SH5-2 TaxID=2217834 RepID=UPI0011EDB251|nr:transglycosylase [Bacillus sp. SH5-2]KAA0766706.1 transglycosylase [Bacillus sp. SH5-2]